MDMEKMMGRACSRSRGGGGGEKGLPCVVNG